MIAAVDSQRTAGVFGPVRGWRLVWRWKSRWRLGRPRLSLGVRNLIATMAAENPTWGSQRIVGELLKLGIVASKRSVLRYRRRGPAGPSRTWRTFLRNHRPTPWACEGLPEAAVLRAVKGAGPLVVAAVLAYLPVAVWGRAKAAAACAGVHPAITASGRTERSRLSRSGSSRLRRYLYLGALAARVWDPEMRAFYERLVGRGKAKQAAMVGVMHKLLRRLMGRLRAFRGGASLGQQAPAAESTPPTSVLPTPAA